MHIAREAAGPVVFVPEIRAVPGQGLEGDRYFRKTGTYSARPGTGREVTLIEAEAYEAIAQESGIVLAPGTSRRNITTRGVPLNHLVGQRFRIGDVTLEGVRLCEPCAHLERLTQAGVRESLIHRGGLRARILTEGTLHIGDPIQPVGP
ncbi:MAG TPA: MOSC domain-containing protein [Candidatus Methylomirabilis sp.]|nr:MOSC domain-containing protein [Candidatus Methylomirabilis sp.]